jgi:hypothetical protein
MPESDYAHEVIAAGIYLFWVGFCVKIPPKCDANVLQRLGHTPDAGNVMSLPVGRNVTSVHESTQHAGD